MAIQIPRDFRRVIVAASVGNVIEWYDFYIFGSLAAVLSVKFFEQSHPIAALLSTIALFTAGFLIRPLGAFLFGWMGDRVGRKYTFLVTLSGMGLGTGAIGLIPTYESGFGTRRCRCRITSATAGVADWCRSSLRQLSRPPAASATR
jgi:MFS family permease